MKNYTGSAIYMIWFMGSDRFYIGSSTNFKHRHRQHLCGLRGDYHDNSQMQKAFYKYGEENFTMQVVEYLDSHSSKDKILQAEQVWIDKYEFKNLYNVLKIAGSCLGYKHTDEAKERIANASRGRILSDWHKGRLSATRRGMRGKSVSQETKGKRQKTMESRYGGSHLYKKVNQICKHTGKVINTFNSITEASQSVGCGRNNISKVCKGKGNTCGGFIWKYV